MSLICEKNLLKVLFGSALIAVSLMWISCYSPDDYKGDGVIVDRGVSAAVDRYIVTFGEIQLGKEGKYEFRASGLPPIEMVVGLTITFGSPVSDAAHDKPLTAFVGMELIDTRGRIVIKEEASLDEWVWSGGDDSKECFLYRRGKEREIRNGITSHYEWIGLKADSGWGTYFTPRRGGSYKLSLKVIPGRLKEDIMAKLIIKSGGWK